MKKADKPILIKAFDEFTEQNNYHLDTSSWSMHYFFATKSKPTDRTLDYQKEEFLFKSKLNQCQYLEKIYHFINFLFEKEEYNHLAYKFMVEKTPIPESRDYFQTMRSYIKILEAYPEKLYDYISRPVFLKANFNNIEDLFKSHIIEQDKREAIMEFYIHTEGFKNFSTQRIVYNLIQEYITDQDKYAQFFTNILVEEKDKINLIANKSHGEYYITNFNINDLIRFAPDNSEFEVKSCISGLASLTDYYNKIGITKTQKLEEKDNVLENGETDGKTISIIWFAEKINPKLIESFTEKFVSGYLTIEGLSKLPEEAPKYSTFVNACINETRAQLLEEKIPHKEDRIIHTEPKKRKL